MSAEHHTSHDHGEHHVMPLKVYFAVFAALLFLTVVTIVVSVLHLGLVAAIIVATIKATLVAAFFMHLAHDDRFYTVVLLSGLFAVFCFFLFIFLDFAGRGLAIPEEETNFLREERALIERVEQEEAAAAAAGEEPAEEEEDSGDDNEG